MTYKKIWVIGTGPMAIEYANVLKTKKLDVIFIGRGKTSSRNFEKQTGIKPISGGLKSFLNTYPELPTHVIVSVGVEELAKQTISLINFGVQNILVEKPGSLYFRDLKEILYLSKSSSSNIYIAYNRRFYASVQNAKALIAEDGGLVSFNFEFNELSHLIKDLDKADGVKDNWLIGNSSHVIDLAFYIGGSPKKIKPNVYGGMDWHKAGSVFIGHGITFNDIPFSYHSNWESPGRWSLEFMTKNYRFIFAPIERLKIMQRGSFNINEYDCDYSIDEKFKAGIYNQTMSFLNNDFQVHCSLDSHMKNWPIYEKIGGYQ